MQSTFKLILVVITGLAIGMNNSSAFSAETVPSCQAQHLKTVNTSVSGAASNSLGVNYLKGIGVEQDLQQAYRWFCNGALQQHSAAQFNIALMLLEGHGVPRNVQQGMSWLNTAVSHGSHDAELALGILLVDTDPSRSAILFKRAAAAGNLYANHRLAELYYYGIGVKQDREKAESLLEVGVAAGFEKSRDLLTRMRIHQNERQHVASNGVVQPLPEKQQTSKGPDIIDASPAVVSQQKDPIKQTFGKIFSAFPVLSDKSSRGASQVEIKESTPSVQPSQHAPSSVAPVVAISPELEEQLDHTSKQQKLGRQNNHSGHISAQTMTANPRAASVGSYNISSEAKQFFRGRAWIEARPAKRYSIQLVQSGTVDGVLKYIHRYGLQDKAFYIYALQDGRYRYVLLYGDYPNNRTSKKVAKTLPQEVQKAGYWIRTYNDLRTNYDISDIRP